VPKLWLYHWGCSIGHKDSYDYVPAPNVAKKKVLLVLEIAWSVGWYGLWQNKTLKEVLRWG
jgi:6-phosphofructokinase 2